MPVNLDLKRFTGFFMFFDICNEMRKDGPVARTPHRTLQTKSDNDLHKREAECAITNGRVRSRQPSLSGIAVRRVA